MRQILIAAALSLTFSAAWAQAQPTSCSGGGQSCKETIGRYRAGASVTPAQCEAAAAENRGICGPRLWHSLAGPKEVVEF
jgi:hypothetical protein